MKSLRFILPLLLVVMLALSSCDLGGLGNGGANGDADTVTISSAAASVKNEGVSLKEITLTATVDELLEGGDIVISDASGKMTVSGVSYEGEGELCAGDVITITVQLQKVGDVVSAWSGVISSLTCNATDDNPNEDGGDEPTVRELSISEACEIGNKLSHDTATVDKYFVSGVITSIQNTTHGNLYIEDAEGNSILVYGTWDSEGKIKYGQMDVTPNVGDTIQLFTVGSNYNGPQLKEAWLVEHTPLVDDTVYTEMTIAEARAAAKDAGVQVSGVVAKITYANGFNPNGAILVDGTSSIYVYDNVFASSVEEGNKVTITGIKTYWILDTETANAEKFGYKGSCQISGVKIVSNDGAQNAFDTSWVEESTVKDILDTPVTEDITSKLYKVTALVKEVPGNGFTNFYFFDIDGETSTYAYTQCNGNDFTYLREFEGKFCTVYITALNAKSTSSDCYFRFLPVAVYDEGYTFDKSDAPEYALKYHVLPQFNAQYTGDPSIELITSVSSELLGFEGVTISYSSSNEEIIKFNTADGKTVFNCPGFGKATVTITATLGEAVVSKSLDIVIAENSSVESISVSEAIAAENDETVTVRGIVGPSFVHANRRGFYLIDPSGIIAVSFASASTLKDIAIGNEVVISGTRATVKDTQIAIDNASLVANYYGTSSYPAGTVITDKTLAEVSGTNNTTAIYEIEAKVKFVDGQYSDNYYLVSGDLEVQLYSSSASQYVILKDFIDETVTVEVTVCNWNGRAFKLCAVAVVTEDGKIYNEFSFNKD